MVNITFDISVPALISGAIGGYISYIISKSLNRHSHQMNLRYDKYDDFVGTVNRIRDLIDIVYMETKMIFVNYSPGSSFEHKYMNRFNDILDLSTIFSQKVCDYGNLFDVNDFSYSDILNVHRPLLSIAMRMEYIKNHPESYNDEEEELRQHLSEFESSWDDLRPKLINIYRTAQKKMKKDYS
ncbi:hypothetical protein EZV73_27375 [Acidaminobacter sp. JC074]|uniref:hypothetical protein n=1 Tax=Acidaminobacter sp. JC074 TaxID=2530199 RepID=UPI001F0E6BA2|nr:hypothetical protein [Acidaminobacter sp. JC074]MCH4891322.1 hypothetical protein [Acidaminobacter sp. JC074]